MQIWQEVIGQKNSRCRNLLTLLTETNVNPIFTIIITIITTSLILLLIKEMCWLSPMSPLSHLSRQRNPSAFYFRMVTHILICIKSISLPCTFNLSFVFLTHRVYLVYSIYRFVHRRAAKGSDTALRTNSHGNAYSFLTIYEFTRILYFVHLFASLYLYFVIHIILRFCEFHKYFVFVVWPLCRLL